MEKWIKDQLTELLGNEIAIAVTEHILEMKDIDKVEEYLISLLDPHDAKHVEFIQELRNRQACYNRRQGYKKENNNNNNDNAKKENSKKRAKKKKGKENESVRESAKPARADKRKTEFVSLYSNESHDGTAVLLKGRRKCDCEAKVHALINNCTNCGRIVCAQEGSGPCFFCDELVYSKNEKNILSGDSKRFTASYDKSADRRPNKNLELSTKHRDRLLEYDRTSAQRTTVIDDEADYYESNSRWLPATERWKLEKLEEETSARKHASRLETRILAFDFAGRQVLEENERTTTIVRGIEKLYESMSFRDSENSNVCPTVDFDRPIYIEQNMGNASIPKTRDVCCMKSRDRIQDKEYLEMTDGGYCLSVHQPYASLLVAGIKKHEGRTWYASHRGRLWIAATAKPPSPEEILHVQRFYRGLTDEDIKFPDRYPTSRLLGCVTVVDCLPQEEYRKLYPEIQSDGPYVFVCENPYALPIDFPIQGKHKIYKLDDKIHRAATKSLEKFMKESKLSDV